MIPKRSLLVGTIPAIVWGAPSDSAYIFVHGRLSQKEAAQGFAEIAQRKGCQVVSFDLPEHGERKGEGYRCTVQNGVHDLRIISAFVLDKWSHISLSANSLGAYFSLVAYPELKFANCLFLSPILDMENLIRRMLGWFNVTEAELQEKQEIPTPMGDALSWPYYEFVRANPIVRWDNPTCILYGSEDDLTPRNVVDAFVAKFHCRLEVLQGGEHYFHTSEQVRVLENWLDRNI